MVSVYGEALCPFTMKYIVNQLYPTWERMGKKYMKVDYISYGNAQMTLRNMRYNFTCQHGPEECLGNAVTNCVKFAHHETEENFLLFLNCFAFQFISGAKESFSVTKATQYCSTIGKIDYEAIYKCAVGEKGNLLLAEAGKLTMELNPPHKYVPWIVINGIHNDTIQEAGETDLPRLICSMFPPNELPPPCVASQGAKSEKKEKDQKNKKDK